MIKEQVNESQEKPIMELIILEPTESKNFRIEFESPDQKITKAYNRAIQKILGDANLNPFHQLTPEEGPLMPGRHWWEALIKEHGYFNEKQDKWVSEPVTKQEIESLIPHIHALAKKFFRGTIK